MKISTSGGAAYSSPAVANPLTARMHKGINTTADEGQTPIIQHGGGFDGADVVAIQDVRGMDKAQNGRGWNDDGTSYTVDSLATQGVVQPVESAFTFNTTQLTSPQNGQDLGPDKPCHSLAAKDHPPAVAIAFTAKDHGGDAVENISPTLHAGGHTGSHANAGVMPAIAFTTEQTPKSNPECALTLTKQSPTGGGQIQSVASAWGVRRLTPVECERLQGFPDGFTAIPWRGKPASECPDGNRYKALGNSMAIPCMEWIGTRIEAIRAATGGHEQ